MRDIIREEPDPPNPHIQAFARGSVGVVQVRGARERWLATALLHDCSSGIEESTWTITPETVIGLRLHGATVEDHNRRAVRSSGPGRQLSLQPKGVQTRYLARGRIRFGQVFLPDALLDRASDAENMPPSRDACATICRSSRRKRCRA
jgi:AraC family transcriptional regulator